MDFHRSRRQNLARLAKTDEVDGYLVTHPVHLKYLAGPMNALAAVVAPKGTTLLCHTGVDAPEDEDTDLAVVTAARRADLTDALGELVQKSGCKAVGVDSGHCPVGLFNVLAAARPKVAFKAVADRVTVLRGVKDPSEVEEIRTAVRVAERAYVMFRAMMRESESESDLCRLMDQFVRHAGGTCHSMPARVALGESGADPDHVAGDKHLGDVSKGLITWGVSLNYTCLLERTFRSPYTPILLRKTKFERTGHKLDKVYAAVRDAHKAACATIKAGVNIGEVAAAVQAVFDKAGYTEYADPRFAHGVGLETEEFPYLSFGQSGSLPAGTVLVVRPTVRIPNWGGVAHGTCVFVSRDGCQPLGADDPTADI